MIRPVKTVSEQEIKSLLSKPQFRNLFQIINEVSTLPGAPPNWVITSIDYSRISGNPRINENAIHHFAANAVDIIPVNINFELSLPIPLNRNILLMRIFKILAERYNDSELPIIAFESDHIHADVFHKGGVAYYNVLREFFDKALYKHRSHPIIEKAVNSRELIYI